MANVSVFISYDYDHDSDLKTLLVGQAKHADSPFDIADWSVKLASPNWKNDARARIKRCEQVVVMCGHYTDTATGVNAEMRIARDESSRTSCLVGERRLRRHRDMLDDASVGRRREEAVGYLIGGSGPASTCSMSRMRDHVPCRRFVRNFYRDAANSASTTKRALNERMHSKL